MLRVSANRVIAFMEHPHRIRDWANVFFVRKTVRAYCFGACSDAPIMKPMPTSPTPARFCFDDVVLIVAIGAAEFFGRRARNRTVANNACAHALSA